MKYCQQALFTYYIFGYLLFILASLIAGTHCSITKVFFFFAKLLYKNKIHALILIKMN